MYDSDPVTVNGNVPVKILGFDGFFYYGTVTYPDGDVMQFQWDVYGRGINGAPDIKYTDE